MSMLFFAWQTKRNPVDTNSLYLTNIVTPQCGSGVHTGPRVGNWTALLFPTTSVDEYSRCLVSLVEWYCSRGSRRRTSFDSHRLKRWRHFTRALLTRKIRLPTQQNIRGEATSSLDEWGGSALTPCFKRIHRPSDSSTWLLKKIEEGGEDWANQRNIS